MLGRLPRIRSAWKRFQTVAGLVALALFHSACVTSAEPSHSVVRKAHTGLAPDEGVSVVLDTSAFLSDPQPETRQATTAVQPQAPHLSYQENVLAGCIFDALEESRPDVRTVAPERIWKAAYPQLDQEAAPRGRAAWPNLIADSDFQRRVARLSVRYLVVVRIKETLDDSENYEESGVSMESGALIGGGYFGNSRTTSLKMNATVFDLTNARRAGTISSISTGTHDSTVAWAFIVIIPMAVPVFTGDTPSHSATCEELGDAVAQFLNADLDLYLAARTGNLADTERLIGQGADVNARGDDDESALLLAAGNGHAGVVEVLITNGADLNARNKHDETALHLAIAGGYPAVAELLVANGADVNARNNLEITALDAAVIAGHRTIAEFLIVSGAENGLHTASAEGYTETVEKLLADGADVDVMGHDNQTPLHRASFAGHTDVATLLIDHGANVNTVGRQDQTALGRAVDAGQLAMAELLIAHGADVEARDRHGNLPLERAVSNGDRKMADLLIESGAQVDVLKHRDDQLLDSAVRYKHTGTAELLLLLGGDPNAENAQGNRPLHLAARSGDEELTRLLLEHGAHIEAMNTDRDTALRIAVKTQNKSMAELLITRGADVNESDLGGITLLHDAVDNDDIEMIELLVTSGADVNAMDNLGVTPLHDAAAKAGNEGIIVLLISNGADVNATNTRDQSPLNLAVRNRDKDTILLLLSNGADIAIGSKDGESPLLVAAVAGDQSSVEALLVHGADPNAVDNLGKTALHHASDAGNVELANLLIGYGAEVDAPDTYGSTPLRYAVDGDHEKVVELLVARGADVDKTKMKSTSRYAIAVFPLGGWGARDRYGNIVSREIGDAAKEAVSGTDPFDLRFSYFASSAENTTDIPGTESVWSGAKLDTIDESKLRSLGKQYELDAVLIYTLQIQGRTGFYTATDSQVEARLFDIRTKQVTWRKADVSETSAITRELLSEFKSARGI